MHIWLVDDGRAGFRAQTMGLGNALAARCPQTTITIKTVRHRRWERLFFPTMSLFDAAETAPDIVIACGRAAVAPVLAIKKRCKAFAVYIQRPPSIAGFDAVVCGWHDNLSGENILPIIGSVGGVCASVLARRRYAAQRLFSAVATPRTAVLIGGSNRVFDLTPTDCQQLAVRLKQAGGGLMITVSRRTGAKNTAALAAAFTDSEHFFFNGNGDNPYVDMLAAADRFMVTGDSVNMLSEACAAGKPTYIVDLRQKWLRNRAAAKFRYFHQQLIDYNYARLWRGQFEQWQLPPFNETARAADFVLRRYRDWQTGYNHIL